MGDYDVVKAVLGRIADMTWMQIAIKPAKPFAFGTIGGSPVFSLPGKTPPAGLVLGVQQDIARPELAICDCLLQHRVDTVSGIHLHSNLTKSDRIARRNPERCLPARLPASKRFLDRRIVVTEHLECRVNFLFGFGVQPACAPARCIAGLVVELQISEYVLVQDSVDTLDSDVGTHSIAAERKKQRGCYGRQQSPQYRFSRNACHLFVVVRAERVPS